jgi:hypothetical protein
MPPTPHDNQEMRTALGQGSVVDHVDRRTSTPFDDDASAQVDASGELEFRRALRRS